MTDMKKGLTLADLVNQVGHAVQRAAERLLDEHVATQAHGGQRQGHVLRRWRGNNRGSRT